MTEQEQEIGAFLNKPSARFTVTVNVPVERDGARHEIATTVVYQFDSEIEEQVNAGPKKLSIPEQLALIVLEIKGVKTKLDVSYWKKLHPQQRNAFVKAINADIYPKEEPSES